MSDIVLKISQFVCQDLIENKKALVQIMTWCRTYVKPLLEPMIVYYTYAYMRRWFKIYNLIPYHSLYVKNEENIRWKLLIGVPLYYTKHDCQLR